MRDKKMTGKPLDILERARNKEVLLRLRGNKELRGILRSYDVHLNIYLENAEMKTEKEDGVITEELGRIILRGDNVMMVSPPPETE